MKTSYYEIAAHLTPSWMLPHSKTVKIEGDTLEGGVGSRPVDPRRWKSPPHVALANLGYDASRRGGWASSRDIVFFTNSYSSVDIGRSDADLGQGGTSVSGEPFYITLSAFHFNQANLRDAWVKQDASLFTDPPGHSYKAAMGYDLFAMTYEFKKGVLEMRPTNCHDFMGILLARDIAKGWAKICQNSSCFSPYFVAERSDAKYCSHPCAVAVNVKKFRQRQRRRKR